MQKPVIHLNGTGAAALIEENQAAYLAVGKALEALEEACPNARDYYPLGPEAHREAREEHRERLRKLKSVQEELGELFAHCHHWQQEHERNTARYRQPVETPALTPMQAKYTALCDANPDSLVFIRLGDFFAAFGSTAVTAAKALEIAVTKRNNVPMAGIPVHAAEKYATILREKGLQILLHDESKPNSCEQPPLETKADAADALLLDLR